VVTKIDDGASFVGAKDENYCSSYQQFSGLEQIEN